MRFTGDIYSNMSRNDLLKVSHKPQDLVVNCEFERSPSHQMCKEFKENAADTAIFSSKYGVCYTLNSGMGTNGSRGRIKTRETGATEGLSLVLNLECEHLILFQKIFKNFVIHFLNIWRENLIFFENPAPYYMRNGMTHGHGIYIAIHDPKKVPIMEKEAILLTPRTNTYLSITNSTTNRLPPPYSSKCRSVC